MSASEGGLEVTDLQVSYGAIAAVHGIDLKVPAGSTVALIGPNGAGKTTTLRAIGGQQRSRGKVKLGDRDISNWRPHKVAAAGLAQVPQGRRLFPDLTVEENLLIGGWGRSRAERAAGLEHSYATYPRLGERRAQRAGSLSGGEQQMVSIARAMMHSPRLIVMDEPSFGLAPIMVKEMFDSFAQIRAEGTAILLVEQNAVQALRVSDSVYVLNRGRLAYHDSCEKAASELDLMNAYLR